VRDVLAFGSIVVDNVLVVKRFAGINETVSAVNYRYTYGGAGANVAVAVAKLGMKSGIFAVSGCDFARLGYEEALKACGVDTRGVIHSEEFPVARGFIISKLSSDDQILYFYENKNKVSKLLFKNKDLARKLSKEYKILHFSTGHFDFYYRFLKESPTSVVSFDPGQETFASPYRVTRILKYTHLLFMNRYEAKRLKELLKLRNITELKGPRLICVSMGARGSIILFSGKTYRIPAVKPLRLVDPTGAGDSHRAGFLVALLKGYSVQTSGRIASTVASFTIEKEGAQTSLPAWSMVEKRYRDFFGEPLPEPETRWEETRSLLTGAV
jgi:ribokinase